MKSEHNSKPNNRILFLVDHKHRDLPSLSLIGYFLRQMGYEVKYAALWQEDPIIRSFDPGYLVLPKPLYAPERLIRFKVEGRKLIVINTEGNPQDKKFKMNIQVPPDLYFFWNETQLEIDRSTLLHSGTCMKLVGCPRVDFLHNKFSGIFPTRPALVERYGLLPNRKTITIATSTQDSHFSEKRLRDMEVHRNRLLLETADYRTIVNNMRALREITEEMIHFLILKYPDLNLVIKPHPNESIFFWRDLVASLPNTNIHLCVGEPINHLLRVSDLHITHNVCTTTVEALLAGVPTAEIHTDKSYELYEAEHLQLATYTIQNIEELDRVIQRELYQSKKDAGLQARQNKKLQAYIEKYFYKFDGLRCYEHAKEIDAFVKHSVKGSTYFGQFLIHHPKYVWPYLKMRVRQPLSQIKRRLLNNSIGSNSNDSLVDNLGKYDNRIKPGDEEYWFEKFEQVEFRAEQF